jgi:type IV secretory pathway VirD2 relaxase
MAKTPFEPRLGRSKGKQPAANLRFSRQVIKTAAKSGLFGRKGTGGSGPRFARGGGPGGLLKARAFTPGQRRMIVKARISKHGKTGLAAARTHLSYVQRDGVSLEGGKAKLYDRASDDTNGRAFLTRSEGERHQFRFIVAPEDGARFKDLKPFIRDLMSKIEADLGTRLDWLAADHYNTGHPHTHIIIGGRGDDGRDLVIAKSYISFGMRARAEALLTLELGPETLLERLEKSALEVAADRLTGLDRAIAREARGNVWALTDNSARSPQEKSLALERLRVLERLHLAEEKKRGVFVLTPDWQQMLKALGERAEKYRTVERHLQAAGRAADPGRIRIFGSQNAKLQGRLIGVGLKDSADDRHYAIVESVNRQIVYAEFRHSRSAEPLQIGAEVTMRAELSGRNAGLARITPLRQKTLGPSILLNG